MKKELINPPGTEKTYRILKFSQAVKVGNTIWVSGQVGMDKDRKVAEGVKEQARIAFENLQAVLSEAGATMDDIVELTTYHTSMEEMPAFGRVKSQFIKKDFPAWSAIGVKELIQPDLLLEIKAVAVVGSA